MTINAVVLGASGYVGGEMLRLLAGHREIKLHAAVSGNNSGKPVAGSFPNLDSCLRQRNFTAPDQWDDGLDRGARVALFSTAPHGSSASIVADALQIGARQNFDMHVVDCSADFRYSSATEFEKVYGGTHPAGGLLTDFHCAVPEHAASAGTTTSRLPFA